MPFFATYGRMFNDALRGKVNLDSASRFCTKEFIAAGPTRVKIGRNDERFNATMEQGYARYRAIGTEFMQVARETPWDRRRTSRGDVSWRAGFRAGEEATVFDFDVSYLKRTARRRAENSRLESRR